MPRFPVALSLAALALAGTARAAGYAINDQGSRAMAFGLATSAALDGPETLFYNPAGAIQLGKGWHLSVGGAQILADFSSTPVETGTQTFKSSRTHFEVPHLYVARRFAGRFSVGGSVNAPYGLATEWPLDFPGRFLSRIADLKTVQAAALVGVALPRGWGVGLGPTWTTGDVRLFRNVDLDIFQPGAQADADLTGSGHALGWRLGVRWTGKSGWRFGFSARGDTNLTFRGKVDYTPPVFGSASLDRAVQNLFQDGPAGTTLTLPATLTVGVGRVHAKWTWGADLWWTHWSVLDKVIIDLEPIEVGGQSLVVEEFTVNNWRDVSSLRLGVKRQVGAHWSWSTGAYLDSSPVPRETADPLLPDSDRTSVTGGVTLWRGRFSLDLAAQLVVFDSLDTAGTSNSFPSAYDAAVKAISATCAWTWGGK